MNRTVLLSLAALLLAACHPKITPAPPPLRPKPKAPIVDPPPPEDLRTDCDANPHELDQVTYKERKESISMSQDLATRATKSIESARKASDQMTAQGLIKGAVADLITALKADPYNVDATYDLAAIYVDIDRPQCSINLLNRLVQMKDHPSAKAAVQGKFDHLLGRGKYQIDPAFDKIRSDDRFLELLKKI